VASCVIMQVWRRNTGNVTQRDRTCSVAGHAVCLVCKRDTQLLAGQRNHLLQTCITLIENQTCMTLIFIKLVTIYLTSFYGSNLWDLYGTVANRLYASWNIMVRMAFDLPRQTHRYLIAPISKTSHLKCKLIKKFITFSSTVMSSSKPHVRYLANIQKDDKRSVFGSNIANICQEAGVDDIHEVNPSMVDYVKIPDDEAWRVPMLLELTEMKAGRLECGLSNKDITHLIYIAAV
jgi:hypothetical protein